MMDFNRKEAADDMANIDNKNFDMEQEWLKEMIEKDFERFTLPESLKSENLMHLLDEVDAEAEEKVTPIAAAPKRGKVIWLKFASAAACLAVVAFGWSAFGDNLVHSDMKIAKAQAPMAAPAAAAPVASSAAMAEEASAIVNDTEAAEAGKEPTETEMAMTTASTAAYEEFYADIEYPEQPSAKDYNEIFEIVEKYTQPVKKYNPVAGGGMIMMTSPSAVRNESVMEDVVAAAPMLANTATSGGRADVYQTNTQVQGVDESDIVKTDGRYIYHYRFDTESGGAQIAIFGARNLQLLSSIELPDYSNAEMYVSGDRLVIVQQVNSELSKKLSEREQLQKPMSEYVIKESDDNVIVPDYIGSNYTERYTEAVVYNISDHKAPKEISRYRQSGDYVSSRLLNGKLYLISNKYANGGGDAMPIIRYIPSAGANDSIMPLAAENILLPPYIENSSYAVVTTMDISDGKADTKAVLGMINEIMMSKRSLFLAATVYWENRNYRERSTGISRFDVTDEGLKYLSSGKVEGYIDDQFSLDEHNGMLRVATTSYNSDGKTVNNLFVLDEKLKVIGSVTGLAEDERIYSVRFMGDTAYVVTFKETDPLFVIDLSDPKKPVVKGELKIPGFSEYLHPIDSNTLIGLGKNTYVNQHGGVVEDGLKLSLFDVSDPTDPKESSSYLIGNVGSHSEALDNHKAFMYYPKKNMIGFPATIYTSYGASIDRPWSGESRLSFGGYLVAEIKNDKFNVIGTISDNGKEGQNGFMRNDFGESIERGIYIGNTLYTFAQNKIMAFSFDNFEQIGEFRY